MLGVLRDRVANVRRAGLGRRFLAVRANERAAAAAGINVARTKLLAFGISAAIAGIGGVMLGFKQVEVSSANFPFQASLACSPSPTSAGSPRSTVPIVGGLLVAGGFVAVTSNYFFATTIDSYLGDHRRPRPDPDGDRPPRGHRPVLPGGLRYAGNWLLRRSPARAR